MAKLLHYNPLPDIAYLAQRVAALETQMDYLTQRLNLPIIIDKGEGELEVINIDNGNKNQDNIQIGDGKESFQQKPSGGGKQKQRNNPKDSGTGKI